jgi:hypothetical protein
VNEGCVLIQLKLNVTVQVCDGIIVPVAATVNKLDALFSDADDCVGLESHDIVVVVLSSFVSGKEYSALQGKVTF